MKTAYMDQGLEPATNTPAAFVEFIAREIKKNIKWVNAAGIKVE